MDRVVNACCEPGQAGQRRRSPVRGSQPMPVRTPLPIELSAAIAQHIGQAQEAEGGA